MAKKKAWDKPIDWNNSALDWGVGDDTTENLPLDGSVVQKYIKDNFKKRAGYFYTDMESSQCYVFSTEADYEKWAADKSENHADTADLVIGYFEVPSKYAASIKPLDGTEKQYVFTGELNNRIRFEWSLVQTSTGSPIPTGEAVNCTYVVRYANDVRPAVTRSMPLSASNTNVTIQLDDFLYEDGVAINASLTVTVTITGQVHKVSATYPFSFNVINLTLTDSADISVVQDLDEKMTLDVVYNIAGNGTAYTEWYVDGELDSTVSEGTLQPGGMTKTRMINLENAAAGVHTVQYRAYIIAGDGATRFYSDMLYRDFMFTRSGVGPFMSAIKTIIPKDKVKITADGANKAPTLYDLTQYTPYTLYYAVYSPDSRTDIPVKIYLTEGTGSATDLIAERSISAGEQDSVTFTPPFTGPGKVRIQSDNYVRDIDIDVAQNTMGIGEIGEDNGLIFAFAANGRTNSSSNKADWTYKIPGTRTTCIADFQNFDWSAASGWSDNRLNINNGASVDFKNFMPFSDDTVIMNAGRTIEFEFNTMNVNDDTAVLCEMRRTGTDGEPTGAGITVTASEASLITAAGQKVSVKYKSGENIRLSFVVKPAADTGRRVILLFVNGVISGAINYTADDSFVTPSTIKFTGKQTAEISLKQIRVYNRALQNDEVLNNYILYRDTTAEMLNLFNSNNISENNAISIDKLAATIPVMVVTGYLNVLDEKGTNKKAVIIVPKIKYYDYVNCGTENKETCFVYLNAGMGPQGTSSMTYPKRNYRLYGEFSKMQKPTETPDNTPAKWNADDCIFYKMSKDNISEDSSAFWTKLDPKGKAPKKPGDKDKRKYYFSFRNRGDWENGEPQAVPRWTIKADFAESSSSHNTGIARLWNNILYNARVTYTPAIGSSYYWVCGVKDGVTDTKSLTEYNADGILTDELIDGYDRFVYVQVDYTVISGYMSDDSIDIWDKSTDPSSVDADKPVKKYEDGTYMWTGLAIVKQNASQSTNNETVLRTKAQTMADANGFGYDVRTTVDGFPIVMFYQKDEKSDLVFMGKYNFNNDKSNEAVFGFCDVDWEHSLNYDKNVEVPPEKQWSFDDSVIDVDPVKYSAALGGSVSADEARTLKYKDTMQCWELIDSGNDIALYKNIDGWDDYDAGIETFGWARGFEARYPDDQPDGLTSDGYELDTDTGVKTRPDAFLRWEKYVLPFAKWMCGIRNDCAIEREIKGDNVPDVVTYAVFDEVLPSQLSGNSAHVKELSLTPRDEDGTVLDKPQLFTDSAMNNPITDDLITEFRMLYAAGKISDFKTTLYHKDGLTGRVEPSPYIYFDDKDSGYVYVEKDQNGNEVAGTRTTNRYFAQSEANVYNKIISWKNPDRFAAEKWEHFDMYKIAAYYIYLIRFAAVDQTVKNAMFTSEDGQHWYYINYDNDTLLGVRNDGLLKYGPEITRNSFDNEINDFCYAARESTLWNCLEADDEFMKSIVPAVDSALNNAGLTYSGVLNMFENLQSGQWPEKVFNIDAEYKYIDSYLTDNENYLGSLQGSRKTHRRWWLSHRFDYYDALFMNESYKKQAITFLAPAVQIGTKFYITSGNDAYFAYGTNNRVQESGVHLYANGSVDADGNVRPESETRHGFELYMTLQVGSPVAVYNPWNIEELDLRNLVSQGSGGSSYALTRLNIGGAWNADLGSKMRRLYLGDHTKSGIRNTGLQGTNYSGLGSLASLEELDITGFTGLKDIGADLVKLNYLKKFWAAESGLTSIRFADGAPLTDVVLPDSITTVNFSGLTKLELSGLQLGEDGGGKNVTSMTVRNCPTLQLSWQFFRKWHDARVANNIPNSECTLNVSNISWDGVSPDALIEFGAGMKSLTLTGFIQLSSVPDAGQITKIQAIYGKNVFDKSSYGRGLFITANSPRIVISGPAELLDGSSAEYTAVTFIPVAEMHREFAVQYSMSPASISADDSNIFVSNSREGLTFNRSTHVLTAVEDNEKGDVTVRITATMRSVNDAEGDEPISDSSYMNVTVRRKTYPTESDLTVTGPSSINGSTARFTWRCDNTAVTGEFDVEFVMSDEFKGKADVTPIKSDDKFYGGVTVTQIDGAMSGETYINGYCGFKFTKKYDGSELCTKTIDTVMMDPNILLTQDTNPEVFDILAGIIRTARQNDPTVFIDWDDGRTYITLTDAEEFTTSMIGTKFRRSNIKTFNEFAKFTNVTEVIDYMFADCSRLEQIEIPATVTSIGRCAFGQNDNGYEAPKFTDFYIKDNVTIIKDYAFSNCQNLTNITFGRYPRLETISSNAFQSCMSLEKLDIPNTVKTIGNGVFWFSGIKTLHIPASVTSIGSGIIAYCSTVETITVDPDNTEFYGSDSVVDGKRIGGRNFILAANDTYSNMSSGWDKRGTVCTCGSTILPDITESLCYNSFVSFGSTPEDNNNDGLHNQNWNGVADLRSLTNLKMIRRNAIMNLSNLTGFIFPSSLRTVEREAVTECSSIRSIDFENGVETIGDYAFVSEYAYDGGAKIDDVSLPASIMSIGITPFGSKIRTVKVDAANPVFSSRLSGKETNFIYRNDSGVITVVLCGAAAEDDDLYSINVIGPGSMSSYARISSDGSLSQRDFVVDDTHFQNLTEIQSNGFLRAMVGSLKIAKSIKLTGSQQFRRTTVTDADLKASGLTAIPDDFMMGCNNLKSVKLPTSVVTIGNTAFSMTSIERVFTECNLDECVNLETIGDYAFNSNMFDTVDLSKSLSLKTIGIEAFAENSNWSPGALPTIKTLSLPAGVAIAYNAFRNNLDMKTIMWSASTPVIGQRNNGRWFPFGQGTSTAGYNGRNSGGNILYVKSGADPTAWTSTDLGGNLLNSEYGGFTVSATLS